MEDFDNMGLYVLSDRALKSEIKDLSPDKSLEFILGLSAKSFVFHGRKSIGWIAQDVESLNKHCVIESVLRAAGERENSFLSLSYSDIFIHSVNSTKILFNFIESLDTLVKKLDVKNLKLENRIASLEERIKILESGPAPIEEAKNLEKSELKT